ncbi:hypothetical protein GOP47_0025957 [Adiantum capillus-veneris]|uniref:Uncharacterized protein n=1 Tax=Adiantum capillus-veneris TaxID=13818 RepID=A0A9D4U1F8_ADICA|nr:hypothetical protein GOP47_0025957 [Adiantum capillus-veneris]
MEHVQVGRRAPSKVGECRHCWVLRAREHGGVPCSSHYRRPRVDEELKLPGGWDTSSGGRPVKTDEREHQRAEKTWRYCSQLGRDNVGWKVEHCRGLKVGMQSRQELLGNIVQETAARCQPLGLLWVCSNSKQGPVSGSEGGRPGSKKYIRRRSHI